MRFLGLNGYYKENYHNNLFSPIQQRCLLGAGAKQKRRHNGAIGGEVEFLPTPHSTHSA